MIPVSSQPKSRNPTKGAANDLPVLQLSIVDAKATDMNFKAIS